VEKTNLKTQRPLRNAAEGTETDTYSFGISLGTGADLLWEKVLRFEIWGAFEVEAVHRKR
jgi:hypothetical protein